MSATLDVASVISGPEEIISGNRLFELAEQRGIPYCKTDYIGSVPLRRGWPFFTHNGGFNMRPGPRGSIAVTSLGIAEFIDWPNGASAWFCLNACFNPYATGHRFRGVPLGIPNWYRPRDHRDYTLPPSGEGPDVGMQLIDAMGRERRLRNRVLLNWRNDTAPYERKSAWIALRDKPWATWIDGGVGSPTRLSPRDYVDAILGHEFVVCPEGNGIDCHRIWEALYLGAIPIVKCCHALEWFDALPIYYVDDWEQLTEDGLDDHLAMIRGFRLDMLRASYWIEEMAKCIET